MADRGSHAGGAASIRRGALTLAGLMAAALTGCASPSVRIASALEAKGMSVPESQCVGDRLEQRLSLTQLRQLGAAANALPDPDPTPVASIIRVAAQIPDHTVPLEVASAMIGCKIKTDLAPSPAQP